VRAVIVRKVLPLKRAVQRALNACGFHVQRVNPRPPADLPPADLAIIERIAGLSITSYERQAALIQAVRHVVRAKIPGCFVECGVWKGGSAMAAAYAFAEEGDLRDLYLYDTFTGMTEPTDVDRAPNGVLASVALSDSEYRSGLVVGLADVRANMATTGYPTDRLHFVAGRIEETIPAQSPPAPIALLRLDTDWYESTRHELIHLFPLLAPGGVLIIDDYGDWQGARKAVDEYFAGRPVFLHRIDATGRLLLKS